METRDKHVTVIEIEPARSAYKGRPLVRYQFKEHVQMMLDQNCQMRVHDKRQVYKLVKAAHRLSDAKNAEKGIGRGDPNYVQYYRLWVFLEAHGNDPHNKHAGKWLLAIRRPGEDKTPFKDHEREFDTNYGKWRELAFKLHEVRKLTVANRTEALRVAFSYRQLVTRGKLKAEVPHLGRVHIYREELADGRCTVTVEYENPDSKSAAKKGAKG